VLRNALTVVGLFALVFTMLPSIAVAQSVEDEVWFAETSHHVPDIFVAAWWRFGGLPIIGYPVSEPFERDGMLVQHFERAVMERHTEHAGTQYEVQLELLGNWIAEDRDEAQFPPLTENPLPDDDTGYWFPETGHTLQNSFRDYWNRYGGLQVFGYPISQEFEEDGRTVQYFERARFEWHPEHAGTVYEVLLGHLGVEAALANGVDMQPVDRRDGAPVFDHRPPERDLDLPVLMYHRIGDNVSRYEISMWNFENQLGWLRDNGFSSVTLTEVYDYLYGYGRLPDNPVVLTFDDGWASHWDAAAALERYGMRGVFFITLDEQPRMPDWQIADLAARGHEIGGHTNLHPDLTQVGDDRLWNEVAGHRQRLQAISGSSVDFFAYPYGSYDSRVIASVEAAGYRGAVAAWGGSGWIHDLRWNQPRIEVVGTISLGEFAGLMKRGT
jgi:peptidoglycan/xylan/chitin deacetylase (PgdA/CDA1 family)